MTLLTLSLTALGLSLAPQPPDCSLPPSTRSEPRVFTNADLERMAACRYQTGAQSEVGGREPEPTGRPARRSRAASPPGQADSLEADWRARWRSVDQKARRLRQEARELRREAGQAPRDPKKQPTGRRSPSLLIGRAEALEAEARELEDEFQALARREGALPGWLRPKGR
ncbi:MAG: hypothetical protein K1Y01_07575 [Vicinamibacteria bacterium]|nr:hypothetical protein [Vicinamibacteria bacterium]